MSRPSSRASTARAPSSLSSFATATPLGKGTKAVAKQYAGLSAKQVDKFADTIASVRKATTKGKHDFQLEDLEVGSSHSHVKGKARAIAPGAFAQRTSFATAPLTSRLVVASPHRKQALAHSLGRPPRPTGFLDGLSNTRELGIARGDDDDTFEDAYQAQKEHLPQDVLLQEALLTEDLLHVLMGIEGQYIELDADFTPEDEDERLRGARFTIHPLLDHSLRALVERILPLATYYTSIETYVERMCHLDHGLVNHAIAAGFRDLLRSYLVLLTELEYQFQSTSTFRLQRFWLFVQPLLKKMSLAHSLVLELSALADGTDEGDEDDSTTELENSSFESEAGLAKSLHNGTHNGPVHGGEVLAVLESRLLHDSGDPWARALLRDLLLKASQPYAAILLGWIDTGILKDPYDEFFVHENKRLTQGLLELDYIDDYWENRYTLKDAVMGDKLVSLEAARERGLAGAAIVPKCLASVRNKVLLAGKYLNVMRECGLETQRGGQGPGDALVQIDHPSFLARIDAAYTYANKTLLQLFIKDQHLVERLRSLKHYFFIDCGDAFTSFLDHAKADLGRSSKLVSLSKLQNLLDIALRNPSSASSSDPYKEDVRVGLSKESLTDWLTRVNSVQGGSELDSGHGSTSSASSKEQSSGSMTGYDAFVIDYVFRFPLTLVFSRKTIFHYQLIFRFLLQLRHAESQLTQIWLEHAKSPVWRSQKMAKFRHPGLERWKARAFVLRQHMLAFVQHMYSYAVEEVLEPQWRAMVAKLDKITTVDELLQDHLDFLNTCLKELMMTTNDLLRLFSKMLGTCQMLHSYNAQFTKGAAAAMSKLEDAQGDYTKVDISQQDATLAKFEKHFYYHHASLIKMATYYSSETTSFLSLLSRLESLRPPTI